MRCKEAAVHQQIQQEPEKDNTLNAVYSGLVKGAQEEGLDPEDIEMAFDMILRLKKKGR